MRRSSFLFATILALALLGIAPASAAAVTRAQGTITAVQGQANTYVLTVENTGNEAIQCMRFFAASGVTITGVSPPAERESASVFSAGPGLNITPGDSRNFTFTTQAAYPTNGGGTLNVSSTCATGSDVSSQVSGPAGGAPRRRRPRPTASARPSRAGSWTRPSTPCTGASWASS